MMTTLLLIVILLLSGQLHSQVSGEIEGILRVTSGLPQIELYDNATGENRIEGTLRETSDNIYLDANIGDLIFTTNNMSRIRIKASGKLGINTANPDDEFELTSLSNPNFRMGLTAFNVNWYEGLNTNASIATGLGQWIYSNLQTPSTSNIEAYNLRTRDNTGGLDDRIAVEGSGNVGVGFSAINPRGTVQLNHKLAGTSVTSNAIRFQNKEGVNGRWWAFYVQNGTGDLQIHSSIQGNTILGTFDANDGEYSSLSDATMKSELTELKDVMTKIQSLKPVNYFFKGKAKGKVKKMGFLAQEVEAIFPELVHYNKEADLYGINYSGFSTVAVKAIQEQQLQIDKLTIF